MLKSRFIFLGRVITANQNIAHMPVKIGRNDPCPCGSRRLDGSRQKYKKCCIDKPSPFTPELASEVNAKRAIEVTAEHDRFLEAHAKRECYMCHLPYDKYDTEKECAHWLLRPGTLKKDLVESVLEKRGCFEPQAFLRWLANEESFGVQINDLAMEGDPTKIFETTITYKNLEWSFTCAESDLVGHQDSFQGKEPHFHFQMRINGRPFINYGEYHPKLSQYDLFVIRAKRHEIPGIIYQEGFGSGMDAMMNSISDDGIDAMRVYPNEDDAPFHLQTFVEAAPGTSISGDEVSKMLRESREKGVPMAKLMRGLKNVSVKTLVEPGPAVPEKASRTPRKR